MAAGTSTIRFLSAGPAGTVKKQLNDLFLWMSFKLHQELATFGVIAVRSAAGAPRANGLAQAGNDNSVIQLIITNPNAETAKDWETNVNIWGATVASNPLYKQVGYPMLDQTNGQRVLVEIDSPVAGDVPWDCTLKVGAIRLSDAGNGITAKGSVTITDAGAAASTVTVKFAGQSVGGSTATTVAGDTPSTLAAKLAAAINAGADAAFVTATVDSVNTDKVNLAANVAGTAGNSVITLTVTSTATATKVDLTGGAASTTTYQNYTFTITKGAGIGQAMAFVDDAGVLVNDIVAIDWVALNAGFASNGDGTANSAAGPALQGAHRGVTIKIMTVPFLDADWLYHAYVRQINPNIPKDYKEVADHFDGAADTIRAISIPTLGIQKVFEQVPGSFMNLRTRRVTMRADVRENNRIDPSEIHYFLGVKGTPTIQFNNDNESIASMECIMYKWMTLS